MPGPHRINFLGLFCSCVGQAAILGGILYGLSDHRRDQLGQRQASRPLVVELIPLDRARGAQGSAPARPVAEAHNPISLDGEGQGPAPVKTLAAVKLTARPGVAARPESDAEAGPEPSAATTADFSDYQRRLYVEVAKNSRYPQEARRAHLAGVTQLAFKLDRAGRVIDSWIQESSGSELLDSAALEALERAQPLPPIPPGLPSQMGFAIEIDLSTIEQFASRPTE